MLAPKVPADRVEPCPRRDIATMTINRLPVCRESLLGQVGRQVRRAHEPAEPSEQADVGRAHEGLAFGPVAERLRPVVAHRAVVHRPMSVTMSAQGSTARPHFVGAGEPDSTITW